MDTDVILSQLLEFLQAKDLALFRFFPVALCQALGDNLLPFLQELLRVLEVIVLSVKVGPFLPYCAVRVLSIRIEKKVNYFYEVTTSD